MSGPTVTVFIAVFNRAQLLREAIDSVLRQTFTDFELLVIDDGSNDDSVAVIKSYTDRRLRLVCNDGNAGIPITRQRGLDLARGRYFAVLDSDDLAPPGRLARQVAYLDRRLEIAIVGGWTRKLRRDGRGLRFGVQTLPLRPDELHARLLFRTCHRHSTIAGRTSIMRDYGYSSEFPVAEDFDLFSRVAERHRLANLPVVLSHRRDHPGRITHEQADLVRAMNLKIVARQLDGLRIPYSRDELDLHYLLARIDKEAIVPDRRLLDRAADWFNRLADANRSARIYQPKALAKVISRMWIKVCRRSIPAIGYPAALNALLLRPGR